MRAPRLPFAEWRPSPNFGGYGVAHLPVATVTHSADSNPMDDPPARMFTRTPPPPQNPSSVHLWIKADGSIIQMVEFDKSAWGNGAMNRVSPPANALIQDWYRTKTNPNTRTISIEITGFGVSRGAKFTDVTEAQWTSWRRVHEWLIAEKWMGVFDQENLLLHSMISATACPDGRFTVDDLVAALKGTEMPDYEAMFNDLIIALYAGAEMADKTYEERLAYATYRMSEARHGNDRSLRQQIENTRGDILKPVASAFMGVHEELANASRKA